MASITNKEKVYKEILPALVEKIVSAYQPEKIILFGSYAYGKPNKDSDIDLFIVKDDLSRPRERSVYIRRILQEENRKRAFTFLVYTPNEIAQRLSSGDDFISGVVSKGKVLYAR